MSIDIKIDTVIKFVEKTNPTILIQISILVISLLLCKNAITRQCIHGRVYLGFLCYGNRDDHSDTSQPTESIHISWLELHPGTRGPRWDYTQVLRDPDGTTPSYSGTQMGLHSSTQGPRWDYTQVHRDPDGTAQRYSEAHMGLHPGTLRPRWDYTST